MVLCEGQKALIHLGILLCRGIVVRVNDTYSAARLGGTFYRALQNIIAHKLHREGCVRLVADHAVCLAYLFQLSCKRKILTRLQWVWGVEYLALVPIPSCHFKQGKIPSIKARLAVKLDRLVLADYFG